MAQAIKAQALELGFDACGVAAAAPVSHEAAAALHGWLSSGKNGCMAWMQRWRDIRLDPRLLLDGAQSVISLAMNYYPARLQPAAAPQVAYYAYGRDYHEVCRSRAGRLAQFITAATGAQCRVCVDSAPILERYWAVQAGLGFVGRNGLLMLPGRGSYFFLTEVVTTLPLPPDEPCRDHCLMCHACERACPVGALSGGVVDARRCLSCLTIENRDPQLPSWAGQALGSRVYGCDACQQCCPHNRKAQPTTIPEFAPKPQLLALTCEQLRAMTQPQFSAQFSHSAVKRAKLAGLQRNLAASEQV